MKATGRNLASAIADDKRPVSTGLALFVCPHFFRRVYLDGEPSQEGGAAIEASFTRRDLDVGEHAPEVTGHGLTNDVRAIWFASEELQRVDWDSGERQENANQPCLTNSEIPVNASVTSCHRKPLSRKRTTASR